jgi:outer membrane receptor protein involved in Fe transport
MKPTLFKGLRHALLLSVALMGAPAMAQETAGQINGAISGADGAPLANAQVRIVHTPTGAVTTATTNEEGRFIGRGLRLGGPYEVTVTSQGGAPEKVQEDVFLVLGEAYDLNYAVGSKIEEITVSGVRVRDAVSGPVTDFDRERIASAPGITRDFKEVLRADPKVYIDRANVDAIQIAGVNNRFNLLTIDGVRNNDDFGLNNGGYPGLRAPLSLDVIDQLSVNVAPFGVTYSGFQGGNINIVTKSGTNNFTGSAYYYYSDDSLLGNNSGARPVVGFSFKDKTYGATLGGPIVEDKLFFFAGYEKFTTANPVTRGPAGSGVANPVTQVTQAEFDQVKSIAQSVYGYDTLGLPNALPETDEKIFGKINWNINDDHRAVVSYNRDKGNVVVSPGPVTLLTSPAGSQLGYGSNWYDNTQTVDSVSAQLFSDWTDAFKTEIKVGYKNQEAAPTPLGKVPFAEMQVRTAAGGFIVFGPDRFRHFNALKNEQINFKLKGDYLVGDQTITVGYERDMLDVFNAFLQDAYGVYAFNSITDFQARNAQTLVYQNAPSGNINDAAGLFKYDVDSLYIQDNWEASDVLTVTGGLRYERYSSNSVPILNTRFQQRYGFVNTATFDGRELWLPRLSFNYKFTPDTTFRGGVGLFGGGSPNVWISNSYSNTGVAASATTIARPATGPLTPVQAAALNGVTGLVPAAVQASLVVGDGNVNALDPDFNMPSTWKATLGFDHVFDAGMMGDEYSLKGDLIYSRVKDAVLWRENRVIATGATTQDGRPIYQVRPGVPAAAIVATPLVPPGLRSYPQQSVGNDLILTNTDQGRGWVASLQLGKEFDTSVGLFEVELGYTWQDITDVNPATSSTAQSNWDNLATDDINNPKESTSNYEIKHNAVAAMKWSKAFWDDYETSVSFFGQARSGRPYSYTFAGNSRVFGDPRQASRQRQLFYVPKDATDVLFTGGLTYADLDAYIVAEGLDKYRGQIAPRNAFRSPSVAVVDMRFSQDIPGLFEGSKGVFTMDIRNLTNLINSSWGRDIQIGFPFVVPVVEAFGIDAATGKYVYSGAVRTKNRTLQARTSVWAIQFGARYEF